MPETVPPGFQSNVLYALPEYIFSDFHFKIVLFCLWLAHVMKILIFKWRKTVFVGFTGFYISTPTKRGWKPEIIGLLSLPLNPTVEPVCLSFWYVVGPCSIPCYLISSIAFLMLPGSDFSKMLSQVLMNSPWLFQLIKK